MAADSASASEVYVEEITSDPLFRSRQSLFDAFQPDGETHIDEVAVPWAFDDHPAIRHVYIRAFVGAAFEGMTRNAVKNMLDGNRVILLSAERLGLKFEGLSNFAQTSSRGIHRRSDHLLVRLPCLLEAPSTRRISPPHFTKLRLSRLFRHPLHN